MLTTSKLNPWFITGLIDAEGCFSVGVTRNNKYRVGYQVQVFFKLIYMIKIWSCYSKFKVTLVVEK